MRHSKIITAAALAAALLVPSAPVTARRVTEPIRFATFNASLNRARAGDLEAQLISATSGGAVDRQLATILEIVEINDPDVLLINEFDTGVDGAIDGVTAMFAELAGYQYFFSAPSNTGVASGFDLNNDGTVGGGDDAFGFGAFPGQFGLAVFSKFPIDTDSVRTFQTFLWKDMPGALLPMAADGSAWFSPGELEAVRLSSKSHWDVPIEVGGSKVVHFLVSHPTPPVFDGPEDRNGRRNFDEIRFWADYVRPRPSGYIYDDQGVHGGLERGARFVVAGDQNSDPLDGDSVPGAIQQLLDNPRVNARFTPTSAGATEAAVLQGGANLTHESDPRFDTADFADTQPGNLRADYVLPSKNLRVVGGGVFWPKLGQPGSQLTGVFPFPSSDHRLVFVDVRVPGAHPPVEPAVVTTDNETPVLYDDDAGGNASGDDPAIWVHPSDDAASMVIVTAKEGGLRVYDLDGAELQALAATPAPRADGAAGRYNNVDIAYGLKLGRRTVDVAVVSDRYNDQLRFWLIDPAGAAAGTPLVEATAADLPFIFNPDRASVDDEHTAYGVAVYQPRRGAAYVVVTQEGTTTIATVKLNVTGDRLGYRDITHFEMPSSFVLPDQTTWTPCEEPGVLPQLEGMSVDQRNGILYATQEDVGLWRIQLPLGTNEPELVDSVADFGIHDVYDAESEECLPVDESANGYGGENLEADAEGVDIYYGPGATGYVIVSSQGDDRYAVYTTERNNRPVGTFVINGDGVDDVNGSDGLAVTNRRVGEYRQGLVVSHDEPETGDDVDRERDATNFSYVRWADVAAALHLTINTRASNDPRFR